MKIMFFWIVKPYGLVDIYHSLGEDCCFHLQIFYTLMMKAAIYSETLVALDAVEKKRSCWFCEESNPALLILHTASPSTYRIKCSDRLREVPYHGVSWYERPRQGWQCSV